MVEKVTVLNVIPLYKNGEPASNIELLEFAEVGYKVVRQKGLNRTGDEVLLVHPDWCIPNKGLFTDFYAPGGDPKKSKLGSSGRIKAIKFNFHVENSVDPIMSYGLILDTQDLALLGVTKPLDQITDEDLCITKYQVEDKNTGSQINVKSNGERPSWLYKIDEPNFYSVSRSLTYPITLTGRMKIDGSSITLCTKDLLEDQKGFVMSRQMIQPKRYKTKVYRPLKWWEKIKKFFKLEVRNYIFKLKDSDSDYVKHGQPILDQLVLFYDNICLRGEIVGTNFKGSGNSKNPHKNDQTSIYFYGYDYFEPQQGRFVKGHQPSLDGICECFNLKQPPVIFDNVTFNSAIELEQSCKEYFKTNMVEGIVFRNEDNSISFKFMNLEYDAKN